MGVLPVLTLVPVLYLVCQTVKYANLIKPVLNQMTDSTLTLLQKKSIVKTI